MKKNKLLFLMPLIFISTFSSCKKERNKTVTVKVTLSGLKDGALNEWNTFVKRLGDMWDSVTPDMNSFMSSWEKVNNFMKNLL